MSATRSILVALLFCSGGGVMWDVIKGAWHDLSKVGRMWVIITLGLAVAGLLALAMVLGYNLDWIPTLLGAR